MKARLIVAAIGLPLLILMLLFLPVAVTAGAVSVICVFAVYELLWATGPSAQHPDCGGKRGHDHIHLCVELSWHAGTPDADRLVPLPLLSFLGVAVREDRAEFHAHLPGPVCGNRDPLSSLGDYADFEHGRGPVSGLCALCHDDGSGFRCVPRGKKAGKTQAGACHQPKQKR